MATQVHLLQKISLSLQLLGGTLFMVALAEPHWFTQWDFFHNGTSVRAGLWKFCPSRSGNSSSTDEEVCYSYGGESNWVTGPEILQCMALSACLCSTALTFQLIFQSKLLHCCLAALFACLSGIFGASGAAYFRSETDDSEVDWCFYVNVSADVLFLATGGILWVYFARLLRQRRYQSVH